ncbi:hypothetical protein P2318_10590 [Myxococcaceae bacterium GXIMD 01537]
MQVRTDRVFQTPGRAGQATTDQQWADHIRDFFGRGNQVRIGTRAFGGAEFDRLLRAAPEARPALARELTGQPNLDYQDFRLFIDDVARSRSRATDRSYTLSDREAGRLGVVDGFEQPRDYGRLGGTASVRDRQTTLARLRSDAVGVMNTQPVQHLTVNGVQLDVQGATPQELEVLRTTLGRLPPSHLRTLPPIVVADRIAHGTETTGGGFMPQRSIDSFLQDSPPAVADDLARMGWSDRPRLELSREALTRPDVVDSGVSFTVLHETGHAVDERYRITRGMSPDSLGNVRYQSRRNPARGADPRGPVNERFGNAYMEYWGNNGRLRRSDRVAYETLRRAMERIESSPDS